MNQQEYRESICLSIFHDGIPTYEFKATKRVAVCARCGCVLGKKEVRLRIFAPYNPILLCPTGDCTEWFFKELLKRKGDAE